MQIELFQFYVVNELCANVSLLCICIPEVKKSKGQNIVWLAGCHDNSVKKVPESFVVLLGLHLVAMTTQKVTVVKISHHRFAVSCCFAFAV